MSGLKELLKEAIEEKKAVDAGEIGKEVEEIVSEDEEIKKEISLTEDMIFNVKVDGIVDMGVEIKGDGLSFGGASEEADFFLDIPPEMLSKIVSGEKDILSPLMGGGITTWREGEYYDAEKLQLLMPLIVSFARKLEIKI